MRHIGFVLLLFYSLNNTAQTPRIGLECYMATYYAQQYDDPSDLLDIGNLNGLAGVRSYFNFSNNMAFVFGIYINQNSASDLTEHIFQFDMMYTFNPFKTESRLNFTAESGTELALESGIKIPFYLGVNYSLTRVIKWTFRSRIPALFDIGVLNLSSFAETGFETGLKVLLEKGSSTRNYQRVGNPFILR